IHLDEPSADLSAAWAQLDRSFQYNSPQSPTTLLQRPAAGASPVNRYEELSIALETTASSPFSEIENLCCGNAGRIDVLIEAHRKLGDPTLLSAAHRLTASLLERLWPNGFYSLRLRGEIVRDVRFFPGLAGLGYTLLRLITVGRLPCVTYMK
ncbi:MAG TPA: lanthionine synthetase LanC family protein, partial [Thermoanaerobaculia bacterium]|nr:lanthionine synthetase LanC family protein [Thermoanaerobaculia bacterium]